MRNLRGKYTEINLKSNFSPNITNIIGAEPPLQGRLPKPRGRSSPSPVTQGQGVCPVNNQQWVSAHSQPTVRGALAISVFGHQRHRNHQRGPQLPRPFVHHRHQGDISRWSLMVFSTLNSLTFQQDGLSGDGGGGGWVSSAIILQVRKLRPREINCLPQSVPAGW